MSKDNSMIKSGPIITTTFLLVCSDSYGSL